MSVKWTLTAIAVSMLFWFAGAAASGQESRALICEEVADYAAVHGDFPKVPGAQGNPYTTEKVHIFNTFEFASEVGRWARALAAGDAAGAARRDQILRAMETEDGCAETSRGTAAPGDDLKNYLRFRGVSAGHALQVSGEDGGNALRAAGRRIRDLTQQLHAEAAKVSALNDQIADLKTQMSSALQRESDAPSEMTGRIAELEEQLRAAQASLEAARGERDAARASLEEAGRQLSAAEQQGGSGGSGGSGIAPALAGAAFTAGLSWALSRWVFTGGAEGMVSPLISMDGGEIKEAAFGIQMQRRRWGAAMSVRPQGADPAVSARVEFRF